MIELFNNILLNEIKIDWLYNFWKSIVYVLSFFFIISISYNGFSLMINNNSLKEKVNSKKSLKNSIISLIIISSSYSIYKYIYEISNLIKISIFNKEIITKINNISLNSISSDIILIILFLFIGSFTVLLIYSCSLISSFGPVILPISLFLISFKPLRFYGRFFIELLSLMLVIPILFGVLTVLFLKISSNNQVNNNGFLFIVILFIANIIVIILIIKLIIKK